MKKESNDCGLKIKPRKNKKEFKGKVFMGVEFQFLIPEELLDERKWVRCTEDKSRIVEINKPNGNEPT